MQTARDTKPIALLWKRGSLDGALRVQHGTLGAVRLVAGTGRVDGERFTVSSSGPCRIEIDVHDARLAAGPGATRVTVAAHDKPFAVFLRDVRAETPIFIPDYGVAVTEAADGRSYADIARAVAGRGLRSALEQIDAEPEETYENAASHTRTMVVPIWLGRSRWATASTRPARASARSARRAASTRSRGSTARRCRRAR